MKRRILTLDEYINEAIKLSNVEKSRPGVSHNFMEEMIKLNYISIPSSISLDLREISKIYKKWLIALNNVKNDRSYSNKESGNIDNAVIEENEKILTDTTKNFLKELNTFYKNFEKALNQVSMVPDANFKIKFDSYNKEYTEPVGNTLKDKPFFLDSKNQKNPLIIPINSVEIFYEVLIKRERHPSRYFHIGNMFDDIANAAGYEFRQSGSMPIFTGGYGIDVYKEKEFKNIFLNNYYVKRI